MEYYSLDKILSLLNTTFDVIIDERIKYCVTLETEEGKRLYMCFSVLKENHTKEQIIGYIKYCIKSDYPMLKIIKIEEMGKNGV